MADGNDVNKSNRDINGMSPELAQIKSRFELGRQHISAMDMKFAERLESSQTKLDALTAKIAGASSKDARLAAIAAKEAQEQRHSQILEQQQLHQAGHVESMHSQAITDIMRQGDLANVNQRIISGSSDIRHFSKIMQDKHAGGNMLYMSEVDIASKKARLAQEVKSLHTNLAAQQYALGEDKEWTPQMMAMGARIKGKEDEMSLLHKLEKQQVKEGTTTEKLEYALQGQIERAQRITGKTRIDQEVASGRHGSIQDMQDKHIKALEEATKASRLLAIATEKGTESQRTLAKERSARAEKELRDAGTVYESGRRQNIDNWGRIGAGVSAVGAAGNLYGNYRLGYELEQTNLRAGMGQIANRQYDDVDRMLQGDMHAFYRLTKGDTFAQQYAQTTRGSAITAGLIGMGVDAGSGVVNYKMGNASGVIGAAGGFANKGTRLAMGIEQGGWALNAYQSAQQLAGVSNYVDADTLSYWVKTQQMAYGAGTGLGQGIRGQFMTNMTSLGAIDRFAAQGLSPQQAMGLAGRFSRGIGAGENYASLVEAAGRAQIRGTMGADDYMQLTAGMTNVGGGGKDIEQVLARAVTAGMDNAKNMNQMVQSITALSMRDAAGGFNTASATADMLASVAQGMAVSGTDADIAAGASKSAIANINANIGRKGTMYDLMRRAETANRWRGTKGFSWEKQELISGLTPTQIDTLMGEDTKAAQYAKDVGLFSMLGMSESGKVPDNIRKLLGEQRGTNVETAIMEQGGFPDRARARRIATGRANENDRALFAGAMGGGVNAAGYGVSTTAMFTPGDNLAMIDQGQGSDFVTNLSRMSGGRGVMKQAGGQAQVDAFGDLLSIIGDVTQNRTADKTKDEVQKSIENMTAPGTAFEKGADKFSKAVDAFVQGLKDKGVHIDTDNTKSVSRKPTDANPQLSSWFPGESF